MKLNWKIILNILGLLTGMNGIFMLLAIPFSLYFGGEDFYALLGSGLFTVASGAGLWFFTRNHNKSLKKREGYLIVAVGWLTMALFGAIPYIASGAIPNYIDALFETISGFTTTGATVMTDIEIQPKGILFWRATTHWIGGMGIIVLTIAILPILGIGGMQLFAAESPGPSTDKLSPRIQETAKRLWAVYAIITFTEVLLLMLPRILGVESKDGIIQGMGLYDAICHAFATVSTGGFSTKNASVAAFGPYIQYVIIVFMALSGVNFTLTYYGLRGKFRKFWKNEEFKFYLGLIMVSALATSVFLCIQQGDFTEKAVRDSLFQVVSVITTTGFITADYTVWTPLLTVVFFLLFFTGGSSGSTAGGVKLVRHLVIFKNSILEFKRQIHPNAIIPVRLNGNAVQPQITSNILSFFIIYMTIFIAGALLMAIILPDVSGMEGEGAMWHRFSTALGASASCIGNIGPGLGGVGPVENYAWIPWMGKILLMIQMMIGRLELFTVLILFTAFFWKKN